MDSLDAASATDSADDLGAIVDDVMLPNASEKEESDSDSHRESSLEPGSAKSSPPQPEPVMGQRVWLHPWQRVLLHAILILSRVSCL